MTEISSAKNILISDVKVDRTGSNTAGFGRVLVNKETSLEKENPVQFAKPDIFTSEAVQKNANQLFQQAQNPLNQSSKFLLMSSKIAEPFVKLQEGLNQNKLALIDISDKLAAIYGEKEKDIKDKLSDVFKKLILTPFNLISEVDTSMGQKEHNKEKKLKDREPENQSHEITLNKKDFSLSKWINYKLLEIAGEILNISRKFAAGIKKRHNNIKKFAYNRFKKIKDGIVFYLDKIDSLFESGK